MEDTNVKLTMNSTNWKKVGLHLVWVAAGGAVAALAQALTQVNLGKYQFVLLIVLSSGVIKMVQQYISGKEQK